MIEFQLQKATNISGTNFGPFDNNVSVVLQNMNTGGSKTIPQVNCAGQTTCSFTVSEIDLLNYLGLAGTANVSAVIYSPPGGSYVGQTGAMKLTKCN